MFSNILVRIGIIGKNESSEGRSEIECAKEHCTKNEVFH